MTRSGSLPMTDMCSSVTACRRSLVRTGTFLRMTCFKSAFSRSSGLSCGL